MIDSPYLTFGVSLAVLWISSLAGVYVRKKVRNPERDARSDLGVILTASLTLLSLIVGFTFSMAVSRYEQRKNLEETEANSIGTEYVRAGLLPPADASRLRELLTKYLAERILFYTVRNPQQLDQINTSTTHLQHDLWSLAQADVTAQPTAVTALIASGMNDVLNSQGYTQAAWWNRIPIAAWILMSLIAIFSTFLFGYVARSSQIASPRFLVLPLLVSISFLLIADMDSPRFGVIRVLPQNLLSLSSEMQIQ